MSLATSLQNLIQEMDRVHPHGEVDYTTLDRRAIPTFNTAANGATRYFTNAALAELEVITDSLYSNNPKLSGQVRLEQFTGIVRQAAADCHASGQFDLSTNLIGDCKKALQQTVDAAISALHLTFTHYFPAWTLGAEQNQPFAVGPVVFQTREQWIDSVHFSPKAIRAFSPRKWRSYDWKHRLREKLTGTARSTKQHSLHDWVYTAIKDCPAVLKVDVTGSEIELSKQRARFACRTALDCVALLFDGDGEKHRQFVLHDENLQPIGVSSLVETKGELWLPGSALHVRGYVGNAGNVPEIVKHGQPLLDACGKVIATLLDPTSSPTPRLAQRWATALSVYGDGCREPRDSMAVAKLGASLDILSAGGEGRGILNMLLHLTGSTETAVLVKLPQPLTFGQVVKRVYGHGRSQFLHGNHIDPMMRFADERGYATFLARLALRETVVRWQTYTGPDDDEAFRTIPSTP